MSSHPEFAHDLIPKIGDAILRALRGDQVIANYFTEISDAESEAVWLAGSWQAPALIVSLDGVDEDPLLSGSADLTTAWQLTVVTRVRTASGTDGWLRTRVIERIKATLMRDNGILEDENENRITEALTRFQRVAEPLISADQATIRTPLTVVYQSQITALTREFES